MNEIKRIHIAKIPYDIEVQAKQDIEKYTKLLKSYANDDELFQDIEIRITELLAERGILSNGVITADDVKAVREQLGEPKDFQGDDNNSVLDNYSDDNTMIKRKLFRNTDNAILGGVLSGFASYFDINPVWTRIIFIILFVFSAGMVSFVYLIMWIIMPAARTATEKLQMAGKPVTLESIRDLNDNEPEQIVKRERSSTIRRVIAYFIGTCCLCLSVMTIIFTIFAALGIYNSNNDMYNLNDGWMLVCAFILTIMSGMLLAALFAVWAYMIFAKKYNRGTIIAVVLIIVAGLASFGTAVGLSIYQTSLNRQGHNNLDKNSITLPSGFNNINSLDLDADLISVHYIVSNQPSIIFWSSTTAKVPKITVDGSQAHVTFDVNDNSYNRYDLTIYGPQLDTISVNNNDFTYSNNNLQNMIITTEPNSSASLGDGRFKKLTINAESGSSINAAKVTVEDAIVTEASDTNIILGNIKTLTATQPDACPTDTNAGISVDSISSGSLTYNGNLIKAQTHQTDCSSVSIKNN